MVALEVLLKICFDFFPPEPKRKLTRNFAESIEVTCRSKVAKIVLIRNQRWPPSRLFYRSRIYLDCALNFAVYFISH